MKRVYVCMFSRDNYQENGPLRVPITNREQQLLLCKQKIQQISYTNKSLS